MGDVIDFKERIKEMANKESLKLTEGLLIDLELLHQVILLAQDRGLSSEEIYKVCKEGAEAGEEYENTPDEVKNLVDDLLKQILFGNTSKYN